MDDDEFFHSKNLRGVDNDTFIFSDLLLTGDLTVEGTTNLEGTLVMGAAQIKNLAAGNLNQDAVNLSQFTTANSGLFLKIDGSSQMGGALNLNDNNLKKVNQIKGTDDLERFRLNIADEVTMNSNLSFNGELIVNPRTETTPDADSSGTRIPPTSWYQINFLRFTAADGNGMREYVLGEHTTNFFTTAFSGEDIQLSLMCKAAKASTLGLYVGGDTEDEDGYRWNAITDNVRLQIRENSSQTFANVIRVTSTLGLMGINTAAPQSQLDVDGEIATTYNPMGFVSAHWANSTSTATGRNLTSIVKLATGQFQVNFSITMPSVRYVAICTLRRQNPNYIIVISFKDTTNLHVKISNLSGTAKDNDFSVAIFNTD